MSCDVDRVRSRQRVYTVVVALVLSLMAAPAARPPRALADIELTVSPAMTKGAATAPVTIVEFSDYQ